MQNQIQIFDTTLRDGTQSPEVNLSMRDKLEIAKALDDFGVDFIELGWPGSNPKDMSTFIEASKLKLKNGKIVAFGSTRRKGIKAKDDSNLQAILKSKAKVACIFGKTWIHHVEKQLKMTAEENLEAIRDSVEFLKSKKLKVLYDLEHFFDGYKDNKEYALKCIATACRAGADAVIMCDTNGGTLPDKVGEIVGEVKKAIGSKVELGIHAHNDSGVGVANSLMAVRAGVRHVQGTINGFGERTGNADLCQIIPNLILKQKLKIDVKLEKLTELSKLVYTLANIKPKASQPFIGRNAFSHKGGIHVDAVMKGATYEHVDPELVGNKRHVVLSDLSGKANIVEVAKKFGVKVDKNNPKVVDMLKEVEQMEKKGYDIGNLGAEQFLLVEKYFKKNKDYFKLDTWRIMSEQRRGEFSEAVLTGTVDGKERQVVAPVHGGPVGATFHALMKMVATNYKGIRNIELVNYKVMIAEDKGSDSSVRVYIEFKNSKEEFGTVGVSTNILEASLEAIEKGFKYYLIRNC